MKEGDPLPNIVRIIDQEHINEYAVASGDYNPIHIDEKYAVTSPFGRTIAHGMMVAAAVSDMMSTDFKSLWAECGKLRLRFRAPVFSGDTITTFGEIKRVVEIETGLEIRCSVGVKRQTGEIAISGEASLLVNNLQASNQGRGW